MQSPPPENRRSRWLRERINRRTIRAAMSGSTRPRRWVIGVAIALPLVATGWFLAGSDRLLGFDLLWLIGGIAILGGVVRAGLLATWLAVGLAVAWRFVVPPLVGYLRGSMDTRYVPPRFLDYKASPRAELVEGLTNGPPAAIVTAVVLGSLAYGLGATLRRLRRSSTDPDA